MYDDSIIGKSLLLTTISVSLECTYPKHKPSINTGYAARPGIIKVNLLQSLICSKTNGDVVEIKIYNQMPYLMMSVHLDKCRSIYLLKVFARMSISLMYHEGVSHCLKKRSS